MNAIRKLAVAAAASLALAAPATFAAQGDTFVFNNTDTPIHPYFRFDCGTSTGWLNFGGIGPQSFFGWGPLTMDGCVMEFTYIPIGAPPPTDPVKGTLKHKVTFDSGALHLFVVGGELEAREVAGPGEDGR